MTNKTKPEDTSVKDFLKTVADRHRQADAQKLAEIMHEITGEPAVMWGTSMVGFGAYHYKYASGREGDALRVGFSPRKQNIVLYGLQNGDADVAKLGKIKLGKGCIYVNKLEDIDLAVLKEIIKTAYTTRIEFEED